MAQLVEHRVHIAGVTGSSPVRTIASPKRERHFHAMRKDVIEHGKVHFKTENEQKSTKRARFEAKSDLELQPHHQEGREQKALQQEKKIL